MRVFLILILQFVWVIAVSAQEPVNFDQDIRTLLSDRCYTCHGPDEETREAGLRLDDQESTADYLVVGEPDESDLIDRIESDDPDYVMPPPDSNLTLSDDEKKLLRRWIKEGAEWTEHWAFQSLPAKIEVPTSSRNPRLRNEVDHFVDQKLSENDLSFAGEADKETLIRRVTYDLTGLPPTPEAIDDFLSDTSAEAYERVVDRLLDSKHYGHRMAAEWLDVARYSDTYGYQVDRDRRVWPYRDWVIKAFNDNLPYDQFLTWQLAGDLLPDATDEQILATTFCRLHPQKVEGGSVPEEFRVEYVADRMQTVATGMMGLTMECARCHDHKFDPFSQREYYELFAYFNNIDEAGLYSFFTNSVPTPTLMLTNQETKIKIHELELAIKAKEQEIAEAIRERDKTIEIKQVPETVQLGLVGELKFEHAESFNNNVRVEGKQGFAVRLNGDDAIEIPGVGNFQRHQPFSISLWMKANERKKRAVVFHRSRAWTDAGSRGYQLLIEDGRLSAWLVHFMPGNAIGIRTEDEIDPDAWTHVTMTYDGSSRANGLSIYVNGERAKTEIVRDHLTRRITGGGGDNVSIGARFRDNGFAGGLVDEFRVYDRELAPPEISGLANNRLISQFEVPEHQKLLEELKALRAKRNALIDQTTEIMVMQEMDRPRQSFVLDRGLYDQHADPVNVGTPEVLPQLRQDLPQNRFGLARWLTSPDHPLTSRVAANRLWKICFGKGLVATPEDFGVQGSRPTHPELLDWLARSLVSDGWDQKKLLKKIVTSATYRQAAFNQASTEVDPTNQLLARAPRYRWSAEMLRDSALAASGLLDEKMKGPPVRPYDLNQSFKPVALSQGSDLYRRSVYTYWKRTGPSPAMMALDANKRDVCRVERQQTASPIQPLVLMNGVQFVEAARHVAANALGQSDSLDIQIQLMFRWLTSRKPSDRELEILKRLYDRQLQHYSKHAEEVEKLLAVGQPHSTDLDKVKLCAATMVANTIMNFDEFTMKR